MPGRGPEEAKAHPRPVPQSGVEKPLRLAGVLWLLAGTFYLTCETMTARAFAGYSYANNYISDLGAPFTGVIDGRTVHSPLAGLMNVGGFMASGALFLGATLVAARAVGAFRSRIGLALVALGLAHGIGTVVVGAVPEGGSTAGAIPPLHVIGAALSILGGNLALVLVGLTGGRFGAGRGWRMASVALGGGRAGEPWIAGGQPGWWAGRAAGWAAGAGRSLPNHRVGDHDGGGDFGTRGFVPCDKVKMSGDGSFVRRTPVVPVPLHHAAHGSPPRGGEEFFCLLALSPRVRGRCP